MGTIIDMGDWRKGRGMGTTIFDVAAYLLSKESMNNKKLQKLCFYVKSWGLALFDRPVFANHFEAWVHGPVCPELYFAYREWGSLNIPQFENVDQIILKETDRKLIDAVYSSYGRFSGDELEEMTHSEEPWKNARGFLSPLEYGRNQIDEELMGNFLKQKMSNSGESK